MSWFSIIVLTLTWALIAWSFWMSWQTSKAIREQRRQLEDKWRQELSANRPKP